MSLKLRPNLDEIVVVKDQTIIVHQGADEIRDEHGMELEDYYESLYMGGVTDDK
jgi:ABC-2 type transport system ATP-binding protein